MRDKRHSILFIVGLLFVVGLVLAFHAGQSQRKQPILENKPIDYWLREMYRTPEKAETIGKRLASLGPKVVPSLLAVLEDQPSRFRLKVCPYLPKDFPVLYKRLCVRENYNQDISACRVLNAIPPDPKIRDALLESLLRSAARSSPGAATADGIGVLYVLQARYTNDAAVVPVLQKLIKMPFGSLASEAGRVLGYFGDKTLTALPDIIPLINPTNKYRLLVLIENVGGLGPSASNALPALRDLINNGDPREARYAAVAIWRIAPETGFPAELFLSQLKRGEILERCSAARHLDSLKLGQYNEEVLEVLMAAIESPIGRSDLHRAEYSEARTLRMTLAFRYLGEMGVRAKRALPKLTEIEQHDPSELVREKAKTARNKIQEALDGH